MKVFITGGSGFVGTYVVRRLNELGHQTRCLVRSANDDVGDENVEGDILKPDTLKGVIDGCEAVIHLVGIIDEKRSKGITFERIYVDGSRNVVGAARAAGVKTFVYMSANGARPDGVSSYQTGKWAAEEMARGGGFDSVTVFRPSIIFGIPVEGKREFASDLLDQLIKPFPVLPIFGDGKFEMQPVSVESVARAFATAATEPAPGNRDYCVSGPDRFPYVDLVDLITRASGRGPKPKVQVPPGFVKLGIDLAGWTGLLPISRAQLDMLLEGNTCPHKAFHEDFGLEPIPFSMETLSYLRDPDQ